nr:hypothetical protein [uncultured Desulfobacter sp.]
MIDISTTTVEKVFRLRIGNFHAFIWALNHSGVDYVVLRGLLNPSPDEDVDFMLKASHILKIIRVAARFPGSIPCDIYFDTYQSVPILIMINIRPTTN